MSDHKGPRSGATRAKATTGAEARATFIKFFEERGHRFVPSSPVLPPDPTLLFTNAGMNQFKDVFLGTGRRDYTRAANSQKCIRAGGKHNDLEEVGRDGYHHTFFEMLGNWSFGDYYKKEAISWAWELLTEVYGLPGDRLYATVYRSDDDAAAIWTGTVGLPTARVLRFGEKDNFWEMAETGPCGPCSEIHIDLGPGTCPQEGSAGHICGVNRGCPRFIEIWNLVFIQFNRGPDGKLTELPAKHVDTGMGLERVSAVVEGHTSNYLTSLFRPVIAATEEIAHRPFGKDPADDVAFRVIADHVRCLTVAFADGILPTNVGRGYVLRRILRRAARFGRSLGMHEPFLHRLVPAVVGILGGPFPEVKRGTEAAARLLRAEEESFDRTIDRGLKRFDEEAAHVVARGGRTIPGEVAWDLYQTDGFPLDLTRLMAAEKDLAVDELTFQRLLGEEAERSRKRAGKDAFVAAMERVKTDRATEFTGYREAASSARVLEGSAEAGYLVLDRTPFYAESGGQVGDIGRVYCDDFVFAVDDTQKHGDIWLHLGRLESGDPRAIEAGRTVRAEVDALRRERVKKHHTVTHILHWALRERLGKHATQQGSLVAPDRMRFDFSHPEAVADRDIDAIERMVNERILEDVPVADYQTTLAEARAAGAMALFTEKYADVVRVVQVGDFSRELCGGIHVGRSGEIGPFRITDERAIQAGVRRVEAVSGMDAVDTLQSERRLVREIASLLKARPEHATDRIRSLQERVKHLMEEVEQARAASASRKSGDVLQTAETVGDVKVICQRVAEGMDTLRRLGDAVKAETGPAVLFLAGVEGEKVSYVAAASETAIARGLKAGEILARAAREAGGRGGGRPDLAQGGGGDPDVAVRTARQAIVEKLGS